jgi:beta-xylosidase
VREDFDAPQLPLISSGCGTPWPEELFSLTARPGHLRLYGRETMGSQFRQALVARRQQAHCYSASTVVEFEPEHYQQQAGWCATTAAPNSTTCTSRTMTRRQAPARDEQLPEPRAG